MEKIRLGKTGLIVSQLGFGGIPIGHPAGEAISGYSPQVSLARYQLIDTADIYCRSAVLLMFIRR
jgi:aryl-alcohol dehydrogenase-like predicted oxidoreductase